MVQVSLKRSLAKSGLDLGLRSRGRDAERLVVRLQCSVQDTSHFRRRACRIVNMNRKLCLLREPSSLGGIVKVLQVENRRQRFYCVVEYGPVCF